MEKRRFRRMDRIIQIKYHSPKNESRLLTRTSFTRDISAGGFMMRANERLTVGDEMDMKFFLGTAEFIPAKVKVARVDEVVPGRLYDVGLQIISISDDDYKTMVDYLGDNA